MRYLKQLAAASDNLIKRHAPAANKTSPTKQSQLFTKMEAQVNTHTFMRVSMTNQHHHHKQRWKFPHLLG